VPPESGIRLHWHQTARDTISYMLLFVSQRSTACQPSLERYWDADQMQPPPPLLMLEHYCLCIGPVPAPQGILAGPLRSWSSCCKHTLLASPSVARGALPIEMLYSGCGPRERLLAAGSAQAVDTNRHPWLQPDALSAIAGLVVTWAYRTSAARCQQGLDPSGTVMGLLHVHARMISTLS
jgi:hypothetical protein